MITRSYKALTSRPVFVLAAALAILMLAAPFVFAAETIKFKYSENGTDLVETFSASDQDADAGEIEWSLEGVDKDIFTIDGGELAFDKSPDYEDAKDADEDPDTSIAKGKGDNVYKVTVVASGAKQVVEVTVTDLEEDGEVTFDQPQPQATRALKAEVEDGDGGVTKQKWQWSKSMDKDAADDDWMPVTGATAARNPTASDVGYYLRVEVTYTDRRGAGKMASGMTDNPVEERTLSNAAPKFPKKIDPIPVNENVKGDIGDPLVATDSDNDSLLYDLDDEYDTDTTADGAQNDNSLFKMSETGQLSLKGELDFESPDTDKTPNDTADDGIPDGVIVYNVGVMAKDPSGAPGRASVMVHLSDVNESPEFAKDLKGKVTLYIDENEAGPAIFTNDDRTGPVPAYVAVDNDGDDPDGDVTYTVEGADEDYFKVDSSSGQLAPAASGDDGKDVLTADHEDKDSFSIIIVASTSRDIGDDAVTKYGSLAVTIKVVDKEDTGMVMLSAREPQEGRAVLATLKDDDGGETAISWKWFRGGSIVDDGDDERATALGMLWEDLGDDSTVSAHSVCDVEENSPATGPTCVIGGADSALYTPDPDGADNGETIHAVVRYKDAQNTDAYVYAAASSEEEVQASDPANTAPKFPDQDLNTVGDQSETAMRSVKENQKKGTKVGEPITAEDMDKLFYTLSGPDAASFELGSGLSHDKIDEARIVTAVELDYETKSMHEVTVTATDPSGATDTITVMIMVTNEDDPPMIAAKSASECSGSKPLKCDYMENGTDLVETFSASDQDADAGEIEWSLEGVDKDIFTIDGGELAFDKSPDYEDAKDADEDPDTSIAKGKGDNVYKVTVVASGAKQVVEVTVTDLEEDGEVTFDQPQPQATRALKAEVEDGDGGVTKQKWQWSKSMDKDAADDDWMPVTGATAARNPTASDVGYYLRVEVTYTDRRGAGKMASGMTDNPVEERTLSNAAPKFPKKIDPIPVNENVKGDIGDPLVATDSDNDSLLYDLDDEYDTDTTADGAQNDNSLFKMSETGQLSLKGELDFESPDTDKTPNDTADDGIPDGVIVYNVGVMAKDPSGAPGRASVMVHLSDVNESPEFAKDLKGKVTLYIDENEAGPAIFTNDDRTGPVPAYVAVDNDGDDPDGDVTYTVEGADEDYFKVDSSSGQLAPAASGDAGKDVLTADYEDKDSFSIIIVASTSRGTGDDAVTKYGSLAVTIKVVDKEDTGMVMLSAREPQEGRAVLATLKDDDGGETAISWKWFRGGSIVDDGDDERATALGELWALEDDPDEGTNSVCDDDGDQTQANASCVIGGADSALYTPDPDGADNDETIHAVVRYKDAQNTDAYEYAAASSEEEVQASDPANTAPKFPDQDLNTVGDQSETAMRSVKENQKKGTKVGEPITAEDMDKLFYTLSGPDAASFELGSGLSHDKIDEARIVTAVELDYETKSMHEVTVTATDPSGATDTITVMIMVTNEDDPATITVGPGPANNAPAFDDGSSTTRMVAENAAAGSYVGDPVTATDEDDDSLTYSGGSMYFDVNDDGQIMVAEGAMLDYEMDDMHTVTVTASDGEDSDSITVTVTVTDMYPGCTMQGGDAANMYLNNDCEALLDSKDALGGSLNWDEDMPINDWDGIQGHAMFPSLSGDPMRVTALHLQKRELDGEIPDALGRVSGLTYLNAHSNSLQGMVPDSLGSLSNLEELYLNNNMLTGIGDLSGATSLTTLWLKSNELTGGIPATLGSLSSLMDLRLYNNVALGGEIPMELGSLSNLTLLVVQDTGLTGSIPTELGNLSNLMWLGLYNNELSGGIPMELGSLSNLEVLYLHNNMLSGEVPEELGDLSMLTNLWLKDNSGLSGQLPMSLDSLTNLERVRINRTGFSGCVPAALANAPSSDADLLGLPTCQ